jgi:membrane protease YdiL (CAAX protease family)
VSLDRARRFSWALTWTGVALFSVVGLVLHLGVGTAVSDSILLSVLLGVVPVFAIAQVPLARELEIERLPAYWSSIVTLWVLGTACWLVGTRDGGAAAVGLVGLPVGRLLLWTLALAGAGLFVIGVFHGIGRRVGVTDSRLLSQLLPRTNKERGIFALLSLTAGSGEELAYRGYSIPVLTPLLGVVGAVVVSTAVFGVMHAYQGALGIVRTALMGGVLAWGFLASGSLWPAVLAHILIDLVAGIALGEKLLVTAEEVGAG